MDGKAEIAIWSRSISFRAYIIDKVIKLEELEKAIKKYKNKDKKEGWLVDTPYFKSKDNNIATFLYISYRRDAGASRVEGHEVYVPDPIGVSFYFKEKLIIVSTANDSKLRSTVEKKIFGTIASFGIPFGIAYSANFLYWLAYKHDTGNIRIANNLFIDDIKALSSEIEKFNLSGAVGANTKVTSYVQAQTLLALNGWANGANVILRSGGLEYPLRLSSDGRISATKREDIEAREEKVLYALEIHNLLQAAYKEFVKIVDTEEWEKAKNVYRCNMIRECVGVLNGLLSELEISRV